MSETARRIMQNSVLRVGGYTLGSGLYFAIIVWVARYLGVEQFGSFSFILAFAGVFQLLADTGVRNILIRDIARDKAKFKNIFGIARALLWILSLLSFACIVTLAHLLDFTDEVRQSVYIAGLATITTLYGLGYSAVLRAFEEMDLDILGFVLHKVVFIGFIGGIIYADLGLRGIFGALLLANSCQYLYYRCLVRIRHGQTRGIMDFRLVWALFRESFPLGMAEIMKRLTRETGKLFLAFLGTPAAVGLYSVAYKFLEALNPFTVNLTLPLFPVFSRLAQISSAKLFKAYEQSLKFLWVIGVPLAVVLFVLSDHIVMLLFGEAYRASGAILRVLAATIPLLLQTSVYSYIFAALGRQQIYTACVAVALGVNVVMNIVLIPFYSYMGAAMGIWVAEICLFLSGLVMFRRLGMSFECLSAAWRPFLSGIIMGVVCGWVKDRTPLFVIMGVFSGLASYVALLWVLRTFTPQELALIREAIGVKIKGRHPLRAPAL